MKRYSIFLAWMGVVIILAAWVAYYKHLIMFRPLVVAGTFVLLCGIILSMKEKKASKKMKATA